MANSPSKVVLIAGAVMGIGAMVILNSMNKTPKSEEEQEQEQQQAQAAKAPAVPGSTTLKPIPYDPKADKPKSVAPVGINAVFGAGGGKGAALVGFGQDTVLGSSKTGPEINIRYSWTPAVQRDPNKVFDAVAAIKEAVPNARLHIINTDENPGAPDGLYLEGKAIAKSAADGSIEVSPTQMKNLVMSTSKK